MSADYLPKQRRVSAAFIEGLHASGSLSAYFSREGAPSKEKAGRASRQQDFAAPVALSSRTLSSSSSWTWLGPFSRSVLFGVIRSSPWTITAPLVVFLLCTGLGLFGLFAASRDTVRDERDMALQLAMDASRRIELQIQQAFTPVIALDILIQQQPSFPDTLRIFPGVAAQLLRKVLPGTIANLQLAPNLKIQAIYPLPGNEAVMGLDLLAPTSDPLRLEDVKWSITNRNVTVSGPYRLLQGGYGVLVRQPIFIPNVTADERFGANATSQPCPQCYDPASGTRFWGFAQGMARLDGLLQGSDNRMRALNDYGPWHLARVLPNGTEVVIASHGLGADCYGQDSVAVAVTLPNSAWRLYLGKRGGWAPNWRGLVALVVVGSCVVSLLLFGLLVAAQRHRALLRAMFPAKVLRPLQQGKNFSEEFDSVTILFSDIVSYTTISSSLRPIEVAEMLNELYCEFDELVDKNGCYKIETIGDAFMAVGGCPAPEAPEAAAQRVAHMALDMVARARSFRSAKGHLLRIRVGLASGPVAAAVIGRKMPRYCLFGDTVNLASRMESSSEPMRIQVASTTAMLLRRCDGAESFRLLPRGPINVKGKGAMECFWLEPSGQMLLQEPRPAPTLANGQAELAPRPAPRSRFHLPPLLHRTLRAPATSPALKVREQGPAPEPSDAAAAGAGRDGDDRAITTAEMEAEMLAAMCATVPSTALSSSLAVVDLWAQPPAARALAGPAPRVPPSSSNGGVMMCQHCREAPAGPLVTRELGPLRDEATVSGPQLILNMESLAVQRPASLGGNGTTVLVDTGSGGAVATAGRAASMAAASAALELLSSGGHAAAAAAAAAVAAAAAAPTGLSAPPGFRCGMQPVTPDVLDARASLLGTLGDGTGGDPSGSQALHWTTRHLVRHGDGSGLDGLGTSPNVFIGGSPRVGGSFVSPLSAAPPPTPMSTALHLDITVNGGEGGGGGGGRPDGLQPVPAATAPAPTEAPRPQPAPAATATTALWPVSLAARAWARIRARSGGSGSVGTSAAAADGSSPAMERISAAGATGGRTGAKDPKAAPPSLLRRIGLGRKVTTAPAPAAVAPSAVARHVVTEAPAPAPVPPLATSLSWPPPPPPRPVPAAHRRLTRPLGPRAFSRTTGSFQGGPDSAASSCTVAEEPAEEALAQRTGSCCRVSGQGARRGGREDGRCAGEASSHGPTALMAQPEWPSVVEGEAVEGATAGTSPLAGAARREEAMAAATAAAVSLDPSEIIVG